jgi:membrane fusion protein
MLFRPEVFEHKLARHYGEITLARPFSFWAIGLFALGVAGVVLTFFLYGQHTKRATLTGRLMPVAGQVAIALPQSGRLVELNVKEGQRVAQGEVLFALSLDREGARVSHEAEVAAKLALRRMTVDVERSQQEQLAQAEHTRIAARLKSVESERAQLDRELTTQQTRLSLSKQSAQRYAKLAAQGFVSAVGAQTKDEEVLEQQARLQALERGRTALERESAALSGELAALPLRTQAALTGVARTAATLAQEAAELQGRRSFVVRAPQAGTVNGLTAQVGQFLTAGQAVATLLPADDTLIAELYAPSRSLGFVREGQGVLLRYAPYPYQKFGQYKGEVIEISRAAIAPKDLPVGSVPTPSNEALYRIKVKLAGQSVLAYGMPVALAAGTQLEADVELDRRRLIEWVFEPLLSLRGRLAA